MSPEEQLEGSEAIAAFFKWSSAKFFRRVPELKQYDAIFKKRRGRTILWCSYPSLCLGYIKQKAAKGEML